MTKAVEHVNEIIADAVLGLDVRRQIELDQTLLDLDGTRNKSKLVTNSLQNQISNARGLRRGSKIG